MASLMNTPKLCPVELSDMDSTQNQGDPASLDSIFIDDDEDGDLEAFDEGKNTETYIYFIHPSQVLW